jgi:hypothetical protein
MAPSNGRLASIACAFHVLVGFFRRFPQHLFAMPFHEFQMKVIPLFLLARRSISP